MNNAKQRQLSHFRISQPNLVFVHFFYGVIGQTLKEVNKSSVIFKMIYYCYYFHCSFLLWWWRFSFNFWILKVFHFKKMRKKKLSHSPRLYCAVLECEILIKFVGLYFKYWSLQWIRKQVFNKG